MIARLDHLRKHPAVFQHLTGLTVVVFDELAAEVVPAIEAAHREALDRPDGVACVHALDRGVIAPTLSAARGQTVRDGVVVVARGEHPLPDRGPPPHPSRGSAPPSTCRPAGRRCITPGLGGWWSALCWA